MINNTVDKPNEKGHDAIMLAWVVKDIYHAQGHYTSALK